MTLPTPLTNPYRKRPPLATINSTMAGPAIIVSSRTSSCSMEESSSSNNDDNENNEYWGQVDDQLIRSCSSITGFFSPQQRRVRFERHMEALRLKLLSPENSTNTNNQIEEY